MRARAKVAREQFRLYLTWKLQTRHGDKIAGIRKTGTADQAVLLYHRRNVETGEREESSPMHWIEAIQKSKDRNFILNLFQIDIEFKIYDKRKKYVFQYGLSFHTDTL